MIDDDDLIDSDTSDDAIEVKPAAPNADVVRKIVEARIQRASSEKRVELGTRWCDRAIRAHLAEALGDAGSLEASAIARTAPSVASDMRAVLHVLARVSSAHPQRAVTAVPNVEIAVQALSQALAHARAVHADPQELLVVSSWLAKALIALGRDPDDEARAQLDDLGGLSDA